MPGRYRNCSAEDESIKVCDPCRGAVDLDMWKYEGEVVPQAHEKTYTCGWCQKQKRYRQHDYRIRLARAKKRK